MSDKKNLLLNLLSYITYKDKKPVKEFYIPEINEKGEGRKQGANSQEDPGSNSEGRPEKNMGFKKPLPIFEAQKEKAKEAKQADDKTISTDIEQNKNYINYKFNAPANKDIIIREFMVANCHKAFIAYLDGMVDRAIINNFILRPLLKDMEPSMEDGTCRLDFILNSILETTQAKKITNPNDVLYEILSGNTLLYLDNCDFYISSETKGFPSRSVEKPQIEGVVTGAQEAFNENLRTNASLVRKIIKNPSLTTEFIKIGNANQNQCAVMYMKDIANPAVVDEVKRRITSLNADFILGDGMLGQFIDDNPFSIIPTSLVTERPDRTAAHISEGKVAILTEGVPFSIVVPVTVFSLLHSSEDAYMRFPFGTALRFIRLFAVFVAILLPGMYVAITNFHQEMIPTDLLLAIAKAKENVPFPTLIEVLLMEISFELIREAGIRIPGIIGNTLGIIGALILGQAAVQANIVSPVLVIVVAVTGLGTFAIPNYNLALAARLMRFAFILLGAMLGFYGVTIGVALFSVYFYSLKSFGVPFFAPLAPRTKKSRDLFIRYPAFMQENRPDYVNAVRTDRQPEISRKWEQQDAKSGDEGKEDEDD